MSRIVQLNRPSAPAQFVATVCHCGAVKLVAAWIRYVWPGMPAQLSRPQPSGKGQRPMVGVPGLANAHWIAVLFCGNSPTVVEPLAPLYKSCPKPPGFPATNVTTTQMCNRWPAGTVRLTLRSTLGNGQCTV